MFPKAKNLSQNKKHSKFLAQEEQTLKMSPRSQRSQLENRDSTPVQWSGTARVRTMVISRGICCLREHNAWNCVSSSLLTLQQPKLLAVKKLASAVNVRDEVMWRCLKLDVFRRGKDMICVFVVAEKN